MSDEGFKVQMTLNAPPSAQFSKGSMLNLRGNSVSEVVEQLQEAQAAGLLELASEVEAVWTAAAGVGARTESVQPAQHATVTQGNFGGNQQQAAPAGPSAPAPSCPHGPRKWISKAGRTGQWFAWGCSARQGDPTACQRPNNMLWANEDGTLKNG